MKEFYKEYLSSDEWLINEEGWDQQRQGISESQFALGNGYLGSRAIFEEIPFDATPGTYIAGIYDRFGSKVPDMVNLPNPIHLKLTVHGEKIGMGTMDVLSHSRVLDMRKGILARHTLFQCSHKDRFDIQSIRFLSMDKKYLGVMQVWITSLDADAEVTVESIFDTNVSNKGAVTEGRKRHFNITEISKFENGNFLAVQTFEEKISVAYASSILVRGPKRAVKMRGDIFRLRLKKNKTITITKYFTICDSKSRAIKDLDLKKSAIAHLTKNMKSGFDRLLLQHMRCWGRLWMASDIGIKGAVEDIQKVVRFIIYHMLICGQDNNGFSSIGARTISGEDYLGHVFWDVEIFLLPFYIYTHPKIARSLLLYRYNRLDAARRIAHNNGYKGAMFPWESADTGEEATPTWAKNLDGSIIYITTNKFEHHITADIAFAYYYYYLVTGDIDFMLKYGFEMLFETARFWASRVEYNKKRGLYEIRNVTGPDEFHENINNNAYTNMLAKKNLQISYKMFKKLKEKYPLHYKRILKKIGLKDREAKEWKRFSSRIKLNIRRDRLIEQFDGYFRKRKVLISGFDSHFMPLMPRWIKVKDFHKTQLVKQADVIMLLYLLGDSFSLKTKKRNYQYYIKRTLHKSSLSPAIYSLMAIEVGDYLKAFQLFLIALYTDIKNIHGNTAGGIHAATLGGVWQVLINGFAGVRVLNEILSVRPRLPKDWKSIHFGVKYHGFELKFSISKDAVKIRVLRRRGGKIKVRILGATRELRAGREYIFKYE